MNEGNTVPEVIVVSKRKTASRIVPPVFSAPEVPVEPKYKLYLYTPNGLLRAEISRGVYAEYSRRYGDVMRAIHSSNWQTMLEIWIAYKNLTKRLKFDITRTQEQINAAVEEMVNAGLVLKR